MARIKLYIDKRYPLSGGRHPIKISLTHRGTSALFQTGILNKNLKELGPYQVLRHNVKKRKPLFPKLTTYYARHSWATVASDLDIPEKTIAAALGHGGNTITDIYIDFDMKKVDCANRQVLDALGIDEEMKTDLVNLLEK